MSGKPSTVRVHGPLREYARGFAADLAERGYAEGSVVHHLYLLGHLSRWLAEHQLDLVQLSEERAACFLRDRRGAGKTNRSSPRALVPLLRYLRGMGAVPVPLPQVAATQLDQVIDEFTTHLLRDRGLAAQSITYYRRAAHLFLSTQISSPTSTGIAALTAANVSAFLLERARSHPGAGLANIVTGLRAFLRFLHFRGHVPVPIAAAALGPPGWRRDSLPKGLEPAELATLLASIQRSTPVGRRDYAILLLLARFGLRAGEVAALRLDDVCWRKGEIVIYGKGGRREPLPLPVDVGEGLAEYCGEGRPRSQSRQVFLQGVAPHAPMSRVGITALVYRATLRAGLSRMGPHRLRHTAASTMRRAGVSLDEIGQVLRHRDVQTTALYARDDLEALHAVVVPWPGSLA